MGKWTWDPDAFVSFEKVGLGLWYEDDGVHHGIVITIGPFHFELMWYTD